MIRAALALAAIVAFRGAFAAEGGLELLVARYADAAAAEDLANYEPTFAWEMGPPTQRQLQFLAQRGIFADSVENMGKASLLIDRLIRRQEEGLSTPRQIRCLERFGFRQVGTWTFDQASKMISRLADNRWHIPFGMNVSAYTP